MLRAKAKAGSQGAATVLESLDSARTKVEGMTEEQEKDHARLQDLLDAKYGLARSPRSSQGMPCFASIGSPRLVTHSLSRRSKTSSSFRSTPFAARTTSVTTSST